MIARRLLTLNTEFPPVLSPAGNHLRCVVVNDMGSVAGHGPIHAMVPRLITEVPVPPSRQVFGGSTGITVRLMFRDGIGWVEGLIGSFRVR
jgi:hypothetical protein